MAGTAEEPETPHGPLGPLVDPVPVLVRGMCLGVCLSGLGLGALAIFKSDNELGTVGAFVVAIFFGVIGLTGQVPRVNFGGNAIDPNVYYGDGVRDGADAVSDAVTEAALETDDPKQIVAIARATEARLDRHFNGRRIRLERFRDDDERLKVRIKSENGQIIGIMDDSPDLWK